MPEDMTTTDVEAEEKSPVERVSEEMEKLGEELVKLHNEGLSVLSVNWEEEKKHIIVECDSITSQDFNKSLES